MIYKLDDVGHSLVNKVIEGGALALLNKLPDESVDAIVTDPPYGIDYQSARRIDKSQWKPKIKNDKAPYIWWLAEAFRVLKVEGALLCFTRYDVEKDFRWAMEIAGLTPKAQIIWDKGIHGMGDLSGDVAPQHENIIFATKGKFKFPNKRLKSVIKVQRVSAEKLQHPNEKPVELISTLIEGITKPGDLVLDPFMGSFTTAVASRQLERNWIGCDLSQEYCNIGEQRLGNIAVH